MLKIHIAYSRFKAFEIF